MALVLTHPRTLHVAETLSKQESLIVILVLEQFMEIRTLGTATHQSLDAFGLSRVTGLGLLGPCVQILIDERCVDVFVISL